MTAGAGDSWGLNPCLGVREPKQADRGAPEEKLLVVLAREVRKIQERVQVWLECTHHLVGIFDDGKWVS